MKLSQLLKNCNIKYDGKDVEIEGISFDSRKVKNGDLYVSLKGKYNGNDYIIDAINNGAVAIVCEDNIKSTVPLIVVENTRIALSQISKVFYNNACDDMTIIMVTGTNGKTSITYILNIILKENHTRCAIIGTNGIFVDKKQLYYGLTTPDPVDLHYYFQVLKNMGVTHIVMEASAHSIYLHKLYGITPKAIIFTNLTNEHLDYFGSMEKYADTKIGYINSLNAIKIANIDDEYSKQIVGDEILYYGLKNPSDAFAINIKDCINGLEFCANVMDNIFNIKSGLSGVYNVYNLLASITCAYCLGIDNKIIENGIKNLKNIPGRFNKFFLDLNRLIVVDFAHTPDGFEKVLSEIKLFRSNRIITIFGCVGYSDKYKRKLMGEIASKYSDKIILTTDNIGYEDIRNVNKDIASGISVPYTEIDDRSKAIQYAFQDFLPNDTIVILGKGCETSNLINGIKVPYSDIKQVEKTIEEYFNVKKGENIEDSIV